MSTVGNNIKAYRNLLKMSQQELADICQKTRQCISSWEKDRTKPDYEDLAIIANALNCGREDLLSTEEPSLIAQGITLTEEELALVSFYRQADSATRKSILASINYISLSELLGGN